MFHKISQLEQHDKIHSREKPYECEICLKRYIVKSSLVEHLKTHETGTPSPKEINKCLSCGKKYSCSSALRRHEKKFHLKQYIAKSSLVEHMKTYETGTPFPKDTNKCPECGKKYSCSSALRRHEKKIHFGNVKVHKCDLCEKMFSEKFHLKQHYMIHTGEKPFQCEICERRFSQKSNLVTHKKNHETDIFSLIKKHKCLECGKEYSSYASLGRHEKTHFGGAKIHKCDLCDKSFFKSSILRQHLLIHTGEKPFQCEICNKCFNKKSTLVTHTKLHMTGLPSPVQVQKCSQCGKEFKSISGLWKHKKTHLKSQNS